MINNRKRQGADISAYEKDRRFCLLMRITLIVLAILLVGILTACSEDTSIADYQALEAEFRALVEETELTATGETIFDLQAIEGAVLHSDFTQIQVQGLDEGMEIHRALAGNVPFSEVELIFTGGAGYISMGHIMPILLDAIFEEIDAEALGVSLDDVSYEDMLGGVYTHLQMTGDTLEDMVGAIRDDRETHTGLYGAFTEEALSEYLSYHDGVFRIEVAGESVGSYLDAVLEDISLDDLELVLASLLMLVEIDDDLLIALENNFSGWLRDADLTNAQLVIEREKPDDNTYRQNVELYVPGRVSLTQAATIVLGASTPISVPDQFLTEKELEERMQDWLMERLIELMPPVDSLGVTADGAHLELYTLVSASGQEHTIPVIRDGEIIELGLGSVFVDAWAIGLYYELIEGLDMLTALDEIEDEINALLADDNISESQVFPEILSEDGSTVAFALHVVDQGDSFMIVVLVQDVPESRYVLSLMLVLFEDLWVQEDMEVIEELSGHFGVDLTEFLPW